jgi:NADH dehydrogenase [ubiquinone] 1 alpha subcomplex assembly factor 7
MNPLTQIIRDRIKEKGPVSVREFMTLALSHPEYGYYSRQKAFGKTGDFVTAPEISQMFGELIGLWCIDIWYKLGAPERFNLVELGPGNGTLMIDALRSSSLVPNFVKAAKIHFVENSSRLVRKQKAALSHTPTFWHTEFPDLEDFPTIVIANEFFDALPIRQFEMKSGKWHERLIDWNEDQFTFTTDAAPEANLQPHPDIEEGTIFETSPLSDNVLDKICKTLRKTGGAALVIDYGASTSNYGDSFQAVRHHKPQNPLTDPGLADLTSHVKFHHLMDIAKQNSMDVNGPTPQGRFLELLGIEARAALLSRSATEEQQKTIASELRRLTSAAEMGTLFKVIAFSHKLATPPEGFDVKNADKPDT